jgi:nucleoside-diphosphate-sugar epimerase
MTKTIAITGATGFAGRHAVSALLAKGHRVRALVRDPRTAQLPNEVALVHGDVASGEALRSLSEGADTLLHLAGAIAAITRESFFAVNVEGTARVLEAAQGAGVRRFIHVSSLAARQPQLSSYGASKAAGEEVVRTARAMTTLILRPAAVYGPGDRATLPLFREFTRPIAMIPSTAEARFSLLHAGDLARILAEAVDSGRQGLVELSDGRPGGYGWAELCAVSEAQAGYRVRPVFLPRALSNGLARISETVARLRGVPAMITLGKMAELYHPDWVAKGDGWALDNAVPLAQGFAETLAWYRQQGWLPPSRRAGRSRPDTQPESRS